MNPARMSPARPGIRRTSPRVLAAALGLLFFGLALPAFSLGRKDKPESGGTPIRDGDQVELEGRVRLLGSEPFPDLVLTVGDGQDWYLEGPSLRVLRRYEQKTVRVRGRVELREMVLANGRSLGFRRYLLDVELVS